MREFMKDFMDILIETDENSVDSSILLNKFKEEFERELELEVKKKTMQAPQNTMAGELTTALEIAKVAAPYVTSFVTFLLFFIKQRTGVTVTVECENGNKVTYSNLSQKDAEEIQKKLQGCQKSKIILVNR
jgi:hypothetical protein